MPILLSNEPLLPLKIETLWAYVTSDDRGDEGLPAVTIGNTLIPLVAADPERVDLLHEIARKLADMSGKRITLYKFTGREKVETIEPGHRRN